MFPTEWSFNLCNSYTLFQSHVLLSQFDVQCTLLRKKLIQHIRYPYFTCKSEILDVTDASKLTALLKQKGLWHLHEQETRSGHRLYWLAVPTTLAREEAMWTELWYFFVFTWISRFGQPSIPVTPVKYICFSHSLGFFSQVNSSQFLLMFCWHIWYITRNLRILEYCLHSTSVISGLRTKLLLIVFILFNLGNSISLNITWLKGLF